MCRITMAHTMKQRITSKSLLERPCVGSFDSYYIRRLLCWAGHVARMPMDRIPRKLLTGWVKHARPVGCPKIIWGCTPNKALGSCDIPTDFGQWSILAEDCRLWQEVPASSNDFDTRQMARAFRRPHIVPLSLLLETKKSSSSQVKF